MTDGKYCTLAQFKQFIIGTKVSGNPSVFQGAVTGTPDDNILSEAILLAENTFELIAGSGFDQQTYALVQSAQTFIDSYGWVNLYARERGPVTAVSAVQVRDMLQPSQGWKPVTFVADDLILPPFQATDTGPHPEAWHVRLFPASPLGPRAVGQVMARWSYTGGFQAIPPALTMLIAEAATYIYKQGREMPIGRVSNLPLGTMTVPANFPPNIRMQMTQWAAVYS